MFFPVNSFNAMLVAPIAKLHSMKNQDLEQDFSDEEVLLAMAGSSNVDRRYYFPEVWLYQRVELR